MPPSRSSSPTPPELSEDVVAALEECSPDQLREVADYADSLAEHRERELGDEDERGSDDRSDDLPDDVPPKATVTVKEINDNRYYYWQWREGDRVRSQYKGPVDPDD